MSTTVIAYAVIVIFLVFQRAARQGQEAKSLEAGESDRGSTWLLTITFLLILFILLIAPVLNRLSIGSIPALTIGWIGILMMLGGFALRLWAYRTLGRFYTSTLRIAAEQRVVDQGPYHILRHPGYTGIIIFWIGAGLAVTNWIAAAVITAAILASYYYRIQVEEAMLIAAFGQQYQDYRAHTWRLMPYIY